MYKLKFIVILTLCLQTLTLFAEIPKNNNSLDDTLKKKVIQYHKEVNFIKAQSFYIKKKWDSTLVYSMKQLSLNNTKELADYCHYLRGNSFRELKLFKEAKREFNLISKNFTFYPSVNKTLGDISLELKEFEKAIQYFSEVEKLPFKSKQDYNINSLYENIGVSYLHLKKYDKAEEYLLKSKELKEKEKDTLDLLFLYSNIANLYYSQYKDQQAIPYFEKAYALSKNWNDFERKKSTSKNMAVVEENRGNFKQALIYRKEFDQWKDSLNNQDKVWALADYEKKYAVAQKQKQISVLKVENKLKNSQRNSLFYSAIALLLFLIGGVIVYAQKVKKNKIILIQKNKLNELNVTKDQLFSIVSHDLRSSVNALKTSNTKLTTSLETKNYEELDQLLHSNSAIANSTYSLLDNLLHWAMLQTKQLYFHKESVHLHSIVQQIEYNYKPILHDKGITFENTVSKNSFIFVDLDSLKIILRNLLDNAIKFTPEKGKISIYTQETQTDSWQLLLEDNGQGMNEKMITDLLSDSELLAKKNKSETVGTGLGMQLCKQMIKKNKGTLAIISEINKGTKIIMTFPKTK